jgi:hypothetical protein
MGARTVAVVSVAVFSLVGCGKDVPKAFPGTAADKANEVVRRSTLLGVQHADAGVLADQLGTSGGSQCAFKSKKDFEKQRAFGAAVGIDPYDQPLSVIIRDVYCPRLN